MTETPTPLGCARCVSWFAECTATNGATVTGRYNLTADKNGEDRLTFSYFAPRLLQLAADNWMFRTPHGSWLPMLAATQVAGTLLCGMHAYQQLGPTPTPPHRQRIDHGC